ncbi:unnamed protein product [Lampetra fluviatilis]
MAPTLPSKTGIFFRNWNRTLTFSLGATVPTTRGNNPDARWTVGSGQHDRENLRGKSEQRGAQSGKTVSGQIDASSRFAKSPNRRVSKRQNSVSFTHF